MASGSNYPFPTCLRGHDLTVESAFIYDKNHNQKCRVCNREDNKGKKRRVNNMGSFADKMLRFK